MDWLNLVKHAWPAGPWHPLTKPHPQPHPHPKPHPLTSTPHRTLTLTNSHPVIFSKVYAEKGDYVAAAGDAAGKLYGYGHGNVLFS